MLDPLPRLPCVVAAEVVLHSPPECCLGLSDASHQVGSGNTVLCLITRPESFISLLEQDFDLSHHPGLLVGIDPDTLLKRYSKTFDTTDMMTNPSRLF